MLEGRPEVAIQHVLLEMEAGSECINSISNLNELNFTTWWNHIFWLAVQLEDSREPDCQE